MWSSSRRGWRTCRRSRSGGSRDSLSGGWYPVEVTASGNNNSTYVSAVIISAASLDRASLDSFGVDDHVAQVGPAGGIKHPAAGDQAQLSVGGGPVHGLGGKLVLGVHVDGGNREHGERPVRSPHVDPVALAQVDEPEEDAGAKVGIDVPVDDGGPDGTRA